MPSPPTPKKNVSTPVSLSVLVRLTIGVWLILGLSVCFLISDWEKRGQFGDMFGAVNALFSALAFAVLIYTMWLQREELQLQRLELEQTRDELTRSADAQDASRKALERQIELLTVSTQMSGWLKAQEVFTGKEFTGARTRLFARLENQNQPWTDEEKENGLCVCRKMEELAALATYFPKETILREWGPSIAKAWHLLEPLVTEERQKSKWPEKWYAFANLGGEALRLRPDLVRDSVENKIERAQ